LNSAQAEVGATCVQFCQQLAPEGGAVVRGIQKRTTEFSHFFDNVQNKRVLYKFGTLLTKMTVNKLKH
jgi:hypothetical protein